MRDRIVDTALGRAAFATTLGALGLIAGFGWAWTTGWQDGAILLPPQAPSTASILFWSVIGGVIGLAVARVAWRRAGLAIAALLSMVVVAMAMLILAGDRVTSILVGPV